MTQAFYKTLEDLGACGEAVKWASGRSLKRAYTECKRADWMLWLFGKMCGKPGWPSRQKLVLAACDCAMIAAKWWPKGKEAVCQKAIDTARAWANGKATIEEVRNAAENAAYAADAAYVAYVAYAVAFAANAAADADDAAYVVAYADDVRKHIRMCTMIRKRLKPGKL
jgi:hypothetical protein